MKKHAILLALILGLTACGGVENAGDDTHDVLFPQDDAPQGGGESQFPPEYAEVLEKYRYFVGSFDAELGEKNAFITENTDTGKTSYTEFRGTFQLLSSNASKEDFGYGVADINGDGVSELFILMRDSILEIFTFYNGEAVHLIDFWYRHRCKGVDESGTIYTGGSGGAAISYYETYQISGGELMPILSMEKQYITEDEYIYYNVDPDGNKTEVADFEQAENIRATMEQGGFESIAIEFIPILE